MTTCDQLSDDLAALADHDAAAIARHADHLASCDRCRDARHDAAELAARLVEVGRDHQPPADLAASLLAALDREAARTAPPPPAATAPPPAARPRASRPYLAAVAGGLAVAAVATLGVAISRAPSSSPSPSPASPGAPTAPTPPLAATSPAVPAGAIASLTHVERAAADARTGIELRAPGATAFAPLAARAAIPAGATVRTDAVTRASLALADGSTLVLDHATELAFDPHELRRQTLSSGRVVADIAHLPARPAAVTTPRGLLVVLGTRFAVRATAAQTTVQVTRGAVAVTATDDPARRETVRAGEEAVVDATSLAVTAVPGLHRESAWSELAPPTTTPATPDATADAEAGAGIGSLRAYKPGEKRDRDWNLALAQHAVVVRISGPVARTEITEVFRNDSDQVLEGVYQFPLPPDAQIDGLSLDVEGQMEEGAFLDKRRAARIWRGVIDKATPKAAALPLTQDVIWVDGSWRDPALLDWKRGGRFELRVFPIPAKGARTIKLSYTQVVAPRGPWRQYVYPLPHSTDGSTVADQVSVDVEVRGAAPGLVRAAGYALAPDAARADVNALTFAQTAFVPRGDLVIDYRAADGDAELRAWTYAGGAAVAPDDKLAAVRNVGIEPAVVAAQRAEAADPRPTAVLALRPQLPRARASIPRDYVIAVDASQSMVGERYARAGQLIAALIGELEPADRFAVLTCDSACTPLGDLRTADAGAAEATTRALAAHTPAGASDVVAAVRAAASRHAARGADRERWVLYLGDGFATTGFRRVADVERAVAATADGVQVATIGIGGDADSAVLAAAARGGGGSYVAWVPGQTVRAAAIASLESTYGSALRDAKLELPAGLVDVAPTTLPTLRAGEEALVAARVTGEVRGDVVLRGTVAGQPFEQRYPLALAVSHAAGNGFVPRLWASLAIEQLERGGSASDRDRIVALSQAYGVMSRETSLLVLESAAMFEAFGVDRSAARTARWTGEEQLEEVVATGALAAPDPGLAGKKDLADDAARDGFDKRKASAAPADADEAAASGFAVPAPASRPVATATPQAPRRAAEKESTATRLGESGGDLGGLNRSGMIAMRRTWVKVPQVAAYAAVSPAITRAVAAAETALTEQPDSRERHRSLIQALAVAGDLDRARDVAGRWLERDRLDPAALAVHADLIARAGDRGLALRTLAGLVDLDPDRPALHERLVRAYEAGQRLPEACGHRIALAAITRSPATAAPAARCLRALGRAPDAQLVIDALPDGAARIAAEKATFAVAAPPAPRGELVIDARWGAPADLDLALIGPDGARVAWAAGRADVSTSDATASGHERLAVRALRRGNYLVEISRTDRATGGAPITGTLELTVLGSRQTLPFVLAGERATVGRIAIVLEERLETIDPSEAMGLPGRGRVAVGAIGEPQLRRTLLARVPDLQACYQQGLATNPGASGAIALTITIGPQTRVHATSSAALAPVARCIERSLSSMHISAAAQTLRVPLTLRAR